MSTIILVIHLLLAIAMIGVVLLQKSEGGGLGMGGGGMSGFMTGRSTANLLTRTTAILAACFFATSIVLAFLSGHQSAPRSIIDTAPPAAPSQSAPATPAAPDEKAPAPAQSQAPAPAEPPTPSVPLAK